MPRSRSHALSSVCVLATLAIRVAGGVAVGFLLDDNPRPASAAPAATVTVAAKPDAGTPVLRPIDDVDRVAATLPAGFRMSAYAENLPYPTATAIAQDGTVYLGGLADQKGTVYTLRDGDGDGVLDKPIVFARGFKTITG